MKYTQPTFTLPVSQGVSQEEWDRIFEDYDERPSGLCRTTGKRCYCPNHWIDKPRAEGPKGTRTKRRDALTSADKD